MVILVLASNLSSYGHQTMKRSLQDIIRENEADFDECFKQAQNGNRETQYKIAGIYASEYVLLRNTEPI